MLASGAISEIALLFATSEDFDAQIRKALAIVGAGLDVSRCYMFLDSEDGFTTSNTHEWCAEGVEPQIARLQDIPYSDFPEWKKILDTEILCAVDDVSSLPADIRAVLEPQGIRSIIIAPLRVDDLVIGFLGFDECQQLRSWKPDEKDILKTISGIIATAYSRKIHISAELAALQKFEKLFRSNPAPMALNRADDLRFVDVNEAFFKIFGFTREEVIGKSSLELGLFVDNERARSVRDEIVRIGSISKREVAFHRKDGSLIHGLYSCHTIESQGQKYLLAVLGDITEQVKMRIALQNDLQTEHDRLTNIIEAARLGTWEWDLVTGRTVVNERWAEIIGYTLREMAPVGIEDWKRLCHPDDLAVSANQIDLHFSGVTDFYEVEFRMRHKDGSWVWIYDRGKVTERDKEGHPLKMYGTRSDITWKKAMEQRLIDISNRDPLTGVYNRRYIIQRLDEIVAEFLRCDRNFCISMFDIDYFKAINDTYGHQAGDFILKEFALAISAAIRPYDLLARYGGEEFVIISPNTAGPGANAMNERLMRIIRGKVFLFEKSAIQLTYSCGIADSAELPLDEFSIEAMFSLADKRLYAAKEGGRDRIVGP